MKYWFWLCYGSLPRPLRQTNVMYFCKWRLRLHNDTTRQSVTSEFQQILHRAEIHLSYYFVSRPNLLDSK